MGGEERTPTSSPVAAPLPLHPGDPLPKLPGCGFRIEAHTGRWLLLVVAQTEGIEGVVEGCDRLLAAALPGADLRLIAPGAADRGPRVLPDPDRRLARRLGAVTGEADAWPMAILVEPRGRVHRVGIDVAGPIEAVARVLAELDGGVPR